MQRQAVEQLMTWSTRTRRKPLVIRGARQVGEMTLVRLFAEQRFESLAEEDGSLGVEVKAGKSGTLKSLHVLMRERGWDVALRFNSDVPSLLEGRTELSGG